MALPLLALAVGNTLRAGATFAVKKGVQAVVKSGAKLKNLKKIKTKIKNKKNKKDKKSPKSRIKTAIVGGGIGALLGASDSSDDNNNTGVLSTGSLIHANSQNQDQEQEQLPVVKVQTVQAPDKITQKPLEEPKKDSTFSELIQTIKMHIGVSNDALVERKKANEAQREAAYEQNREQPKVKTSISFKGVQDKTKEISSKVKEKTSTLGQALATGVAASIIGISVLGDKIGDVKEYLSDIVNDVPKITETIIKNIKDWVSEIPGKFMEGATSIFGDMTKMAGEAWEVMKDKTVAVFTSISDFIKENFAVVKRKMLGAVAWMYNSLLDYINPVIGVFGDELPKMVIGSPTSSLSASPVPDETNTNVTPMATPGLYASYTPYGPAQGPVPYSPVPYGTYGPAISTLATPNQALAPAMSYGPASNKTLAQATGAQSATLAQSVQSLAPLKPTGTGNILRTAQSQLGVTEIAGARANPKILEYFRSTSYHAKDDSGEGGAWCSAFVNWSVEKAGFKGTGSAGAASWLKWGMPIDKPVPGCVVVKHRTRANGSKSYHVGFCQSVQGNTLFMLGGNQSNKVSVRRINMKKVKLYFRVPSGDASTTRLQTLDTLSPSVSKEAQQAQQAQAQQAQAQQTQQDSTIAAIKNFNDPIQALSGFANTAAQGFDASTLDFKGITEVISKNSEVLQTQVNSTTTVVQQPVQEHPKFTLDNTKLDNTLALKSL